MHGSAWSSVGSSLSRQQGIRALILAEPPASSETVGGQPASCPPVPSCVRAVLLAHLFPYSSHPFSWAPPCCCALTGF